MINLLYKFRWVFVVLAALAAALWATFVAFGDALGVAPEAQDDVRNALAALWGFFITALSPIIARDADGDGTPDLLQGGE